MSKVKAWIPLLFSIVLTSCATSKNSSVSFSSEVSKLPTGWQEMEVEAKWETNRKEFEQAILELSDGSVAFGYELNVRWSGVPRKFLDLYYDAETSPVQNATHSLRHRTRFTSNPRAESRSVSDLINSDWDRDWERIQFKSTPIRQGAVWFRREVGDCKIWDRQNQGICSGLNNQTASEILQNSSVSHPATTFMSKEHPTLDQSNLEPVLSITDFRYRVEFKKNDKAVLEASMDHLFAENLQTGEIEFDYEIELELITDSPTEEDMKELFRVANLLQNKYSLIPSTKSKSGNYVEESRK